MRFRNTIVESQWWIESEMFVKSHSSSHFSSIVEPLSFLRSRINARLDSIKERY